MQRWHNTHAEKCDKPNKDTFNKYKTAAKEKRPDYKDSTILFKLHDNSSYTNGFMTEMCNFGSHLHLKLKIAAV